MEHPVIQRFKVKSITIWPRHKWFIVVFFVEILCDGGSTVYFMHSL